MDDINRDIKADVPNLKSVLRKARLEEAERSDVVADLRGAEQARLEILAEALEPVLAQVPKAADLFDMGVVPGERPRLFIDVIGFVEMGEDKRTYCFVQDTRHGRVKAGETTRLEKMVDIVTDYIARRLMERERALASDLTIEQAALALLGNRGAVAKGSKARGPAKETAVEPAAFVENDGAQPVVAQAEPASNELAGEPVALAALPPEGDSAKLERSDTESNSSRNGRKTIPSPDIRAEDEKKPCRKILASLWDGVEFLALFVGFVVLLVGLAGAIYFAWTMGEGFWVSKFMKSGS